MSLSDFPSFPERKFSPGAEPAAQVAKTASSPFAAKPSAAASAPWSRSGAASTSPSQLQSAANYAQAARRVLPAQSSSASESKSEMQGREFPWTPEDFARIQSLIYERAGISLHDGKQAMVYGRLSRRLRETGFATFRDYLSHLETSRGDEWQEFVNALTTNLTAFYREPHHFEVLAEYLRSKPEVTQWRAWCSAASTGEEPYSIVMTALQALGANASFRLTASDIDSRVLDTAGQGVYQAESVERMPPELLQRFFLRGKSSNQGMVRIRPEVRRAIDFMSVNLVRDDWPFKEPFDVIFCRNVLIYFDSATQRKVLQRIHRMLKPGGLLFVGHAESLAESRDLFSLRGKTVYERINPK